MAKQLANLAVKFGKVSFGGEVASVGVSIQRDAITSEAAIELFVARRIKARIVASGSADKDQQPLPGMDDVKPDMTMIFECKGLGVKRKAYSATLNVMAEDLDDGTFSNFANKVGKLVVFKIDELPEGKRGRKPKGEQDDDTDDEGDADEGDEE
jgi:hypothetical protein